MPGDSFEALVMVEGAAKLALGTRFKKLPRAVFAKLSLPVLVVIALIVFVYVTAGVPLRRHYSSPDPRQLRPCV
jgi:hypothetical protein